MAEWNFQSGLTESAKDGAQPGDKHDQFTIGGQPAPRADVLASKRNVILTSKGWVRRQNKIQTVDGTRVHRQLDEILVPANPGIGTGEGPGSHYFANNHMGAPRISQIYYDKALSDGTQSNTAGQTANIHVVFNQPVFFGKHPGKLKLNLTRIGGAGGTVTATCNNAPSGTLFPKNHDIHMANNTLKFKFTVPAGNSNIIFKINQQSLVPIANSPSTLAGAGANLISLNYAGKTVSGTSGAFSAAAKKNAFANLFVTGAVTNAVGTFTLADNGLG